MVKFNFDHKNPRNIHFSLGLWQKVSYNEKLNTESKVGSNKLKKKKKKTLNFTFY